MAPTLRSRMDRLLSDFGIDKMGSMALDVKAVASELNVEFTGIAATVAAVAGAPSLVRPAPGPRCCRGSGRDGGRKNCEKERTKKRTNERTNERIGVGEI